MENERKELDNIQKEVVALISDISDLETRLEEIRKKTTELYENTDSKLNGN